MTKAAIPITVVRAKKVMLQTPCRPSTWVRKDGARYRTEIAGNTSVQISPLRAPDCTSGNAPSGTVRSGEAAHYWWVYPNFMPNLYEGVMDTNLVLPLEFSFNTAESVLKSKRLGRVGQ
jgi:hypothetical protein